MAFSACSKAVGRSTTSSGFRRSCMTWVDRITWGLQQGREGGGGLRKEGLAGARRQMKPGATPHTQPTRRELGTSLCCRFRFPAGGGELASNLRGGWGSECQSQEPLVPHWVDGSVKQFSHLTIIPLALARSKSALRLDATQMTWVTSHPGISFSMAQRAFLALPSRRALEFFK